MEAAEHGETSSLCSMTRAKATTSCGLSDLASTFQSGKRARWTSEKQTELKHSDC